MRSRTGNSPRSCVVSTIGENSHMSGDASQPMWTPSAEQARTTEMAAFMDWVAERHGLELSSYEDLWRWSVDELEQFWADIWEFCGVIASKPYERVLASHEMPGTAWFTGSELNFVENLLAGHDDEEPAILH